MPLPRQHKPGNEEQRDQRAEADAGNAGDAAEAAGGIEEVFHSWLASGVVVLAFYHRSVVVRYTEL